MEQHPIPRNISSFQFHLIGDMTLRQFVYLAVGGFTGYLIYKIAPFPSLFKYVFVAVSALSGFAFAFLPIQDRPLDRWLTAFIKSIFAPTQYFWQKEGTPIGILLHPVSTQTKTLPQNHTQAHLEATNKLHAYLNTLPTLPHQNLNTAEKRYIDATIALFGSQSAKSPQAAVLASSVPPVKTIPISAPTVPVSGISHQPPQKNPPSFSEEKPQPTLQAVGQKPKETGDSSNLEKQLSRLTLEKRALENQLSKLKEELTNIEAPKVVKPSPPEETAKPTIKTFTPKQAIDEMGLSKLPQAPNLVTGVVKDAQKRLIPNLIITVKDSKGLPLRALKTNKLGQFAAATTLPNGTYLLEVEDPLKRYVFDIAQIALSGKVFLPIEILAKGEKDLMREKLSKELFGSTNI